MTKPKACPHHRDGCHKNTRVHRVYRKLSADEINEVISAGHIASEWCYIGTWVVCHDCYTLLDKSILIETYD
jgi:hypothetical protein